MIVQIVVTDPPPRQAAKRRQFDASDALVRLPPPDEAALRDAARGIEGALAAARDPLVRDAGVRLLDVLARHYEVPIPPLQVLGVRPHRVVEGQLTYELFGDYTQATQRIRIWTRTARLGRVTSFRGLLSTLLHEFCHHLDVRKLGFPATPHTRGFFHRVDDLYHLALATPPEQRRPLHWIASGQAFRIDWRRFRPPMAWDKPLES
jgi:hypothetical protein